jgi:SPP1 gp7 family putative phage head morphogenesis protein
MQPAVIDLLRAIWSRQDADVVGKYATLAGQWRQHLLEDPTRVHQPLPGADLLRTILHDSTKEHASDILLLACREAGISNPDPAIFQTLDEYYRTYMPQLAGDVDGSLGLTVQKAITSGLQAGMGEKDIALGVLQHVLPLGAARLRTIARTELTNAATLSRIGVFTQAGVQHFEYSPILDDRTTKTCRCLDGYVLDMSDPLGQELSPANHFRCFEPGTMITTEHGEVPIQHIKVGDKVLTHRLRYRAVTSLMRNPAPDRITELSLSDGRTLRGTDNHPALSNRGWVEFASLKPGDQLYYTLRMTNGNGVCHCYNGVSTLLKGNNTVSRDAIRTLSNFNNQIEVRYVKISKEQRFTRNYGELWNNFIAFGFEYLCQNIFHFGHRLSTLTVGGRIQLVGYSSGSTGFSSGLRCTQPLSLFEFLRCFSNAWVSLFGMTKSEMRVVTPNGFQNQRTLRTPCIVINPLRLDRITASPDFNSALFQKQGNRLKGHFPISEVSGNFACRPHLSDVQISQNLSQGVAIFPLNLLHRLDSLHPHIIGVEACEIQGVESVFALSDTVYNFSVEEDESYVANGFIVHNCRALVIPAADDAKPTPHGLLQRALNIRAQEFPGWGGSRIAPFIKKLTGAK